MKLAMIMLAAGNSRRFGENKLLYEIDKIPMYQRILKELQETEKVLKKELPEIACTITIVTQYEEIRNYAREHGMDVVINPHPEEGISSSLKLGLQANREADAALFTVSDQPWLKSRTIVRLIENYLNTGQKIACPAVMEEGAPCIGNPCLFSRAYFSELLALLGDTGGKRVIKRHMEDTALLLLEEKQELTDIDTKPFIKNPDK